jgi:hydrogenase nickel incorporation protein HypA/HybF
MQGGGQLVGIGMHELSVAQSLIEVACDAADRDGSDHVSRIFVRLGALSGVAREALEFSFDLAAEETRCAGAMLEIEDVPITVYCPSCKSRKTLSDCYHFCCPTCGLPTPHILTGRELEVVSVEADDYAAAHR